MTELIDLDEATDILQLQLLEKQTIKYINALVKSKKDRQQMISTVKQHTGYLLNRPKDQEWIGNIT